MPLIISYSSHLFSFVKNKVINHLTSIVNRIINDDMRKNIDPFNIVFACGIAVGLWIFAMVWSILWIL